MRRDNAHAGLVGHQHQQAARNGDVGHEKPRALVADRILDGLNENCLPFLHAGADRRQHALVEPGQLAEAARLARAQEAGAFETDIDKGRLHAGQHALDAAEKDVADQRVAGAAGLRLQVVFHGALQKELHGPTVLDDRDARFAGADIDQDFFGHQIPDFAPAAPSRGRRPQFHPRFCGIDPSIVARKEARRGKCLILLKCGRCPKFVAVRSTRVFRAAR